MPTKSFNCFLSLTVLPSDINLSSDEGKEKLKDELNKAVQEGYAKDYEELILKYYEAIQKEDINK